MQIFFQSHLIFMIFLLFVSYGLCIVLQALMSRHHQLCFKIQFEGAMSHIYSQ